MIKYVVIDSNDNEFSFLGDSNATYQMTLNQVGRGSDNVAFVFNNKGNQSSTKEVYDFYSTIKNLNIKDIKIYYISDNENQQLVFSLSSFENITISSVMYDNRLAQIDNEDTVVEKIFFLFNN